MRAGKMLIAAELTTWRWVPEVRTIHHYHDVPAYTDALAASIREAWATGGQAEKLLFSFHGIPQRYFDAGDPYFCHCHKTARLAAERLGLPRDRWQVSFQSLFGREEWLKPYSEQTIKAMARSGVRSLDVVCPGFSADCLETLEEVAMEGRDAFMAAGGSHFAYLPCLNASATGVTMLKTLLARELAGWVEPPLG